MAYASWSVIFGEQPSSTKWNILGTNDALFYQQLTDGWIQADETWNYASSSTFTVSGDQTGKLRPGVKIRLKQGGSYKYFVVAKSSYSNPTTTVTVYDAIDSGTYTLANAAITDNYYSLAVMPASFPSNASGGSFVGGDGWLSAINETWTYASADDPTYTFTITGDKTGKYTAGMRIRLKQGSGYLYFIITKVAESGGTTTVTVYGGTDYDLANATITDNYYSMVKAPAGFPLDPSKWTVRFTDSSNRNQTTPTNSTWYNMGSLSITVPIGCWRLFFQTPCYVWRFSAGNVRLRIALSTANNSASDADLMAMTGGMGDWNGSEFNNANTLRKEKVITLTSKTVYYLVAMSDTSVSGIEFSGAYATNIIEAVCAYL